MTIPTSGTYYGLDIYQATNLTGLGGAVGTALTALEAELSTLGLSNVSSTLSSLAVVYKQVATDTSATFDGTTITTPDASYTGVTVGAQNAGAFSFSSGGNTYVVANAPLGGITVDNTLLSLENSVSSVPLLGALLEGLIANLKTAVDGSTVNLGGAIVLPTNYFDGTPYVPPCFVRGTRIATSRGEVAVEDLAEGDLVLLARGGTAPVKWIGHRRVDIRLHPAPETMRPVRIRAGALGGGLPHRDLRVSPDHALFLDGVLVPAGLLLDDVGIVQDDVAQVEYFHVELPAHDVILAEGAAAESYLDTGNRQTFANAPIVALTPDLSIDVAAFAAIEPCAEMVLGGEKLDAIRAGLRAVERPAARVKRSKSA